MISDLELRDGDRVRFISDIHLGHPKSLIRRVDELAFLLEGCSHLVVCGDLSESRIGPYKERGSELRTEFLKICSDFGVTPILLAGNHDPDEENSLLRILNGKVCAMHGHALFKEVAPWGREYINNKGIADQLISRYPEADTNLLQRLKLAQAMSVVVPPNCPFRSSGKASLKRRLAHVFWPPERPFRILSAWFTMSRRIRNFTETFFPEAEIVLFGHLHRRMLKVARRPHQRTYINLGACFSHAESYAVDLFSNGHLSICSYSRQGFDGPFKKLKVNGLS